MQSFLIFCWKERGYLRSASWGLLTIGRRWRGVCPRQASAPACVRHCFVLIAAAAPDHLHMNRAAERNSAPRSHCPGQTWLGCPHHRTGHYLGDPGCADSGYPGRESGPIAGSAGFRNRSRPGRAEHRQGRAQRILILIEDQFNVGNGGPGRLSGVVEAMTLRKTPVRDADRHAVTLFPTRRSPPSPT